MEEKDPKLDRLNASLDGEDRTNTISLNVTFEEVIALNNSAKLLGLSLTDYILQSTIYAKKNDDGLSLSEKRRLVNELNSLGKELKKQGPILEKITSTDLSEQGENIKEILQKKQEILNEIRSLLRDLLPFLRDTSGKN